MLHDFMKLEINSIHATVKWVVRSGVLLENIGEMFVEFSRYQALVLVPACQFDLQNAVPRLVYVPTTNLYNN